MAGSGVAHLRGEEAILTVDNLSVEYGTPNGSFRAVSGVSFDLLAGETLGVVGESGCGKSTTGRAVLRLDPIAEGSVTFRGESIDQASNSRMKALRREIQMIFQDPVSSLNPRRAVKDIIMEGLTVDGVDKNTRSAKVPGLMDQIGLPSDRFAEMMPRQLSGGQAQRVAIGRALAVEPGLLICDEPVSALDVSVQAQILNLLEDLKREYELSIVFIAHDLSVVRSFSDKVLVMYLGKTCEFGDPVEVYERPAHPYTRGLLDSVPSPESVGGFAGPALQGDIPSPLKPPTGCRFRARCPIARDECAQEEPVMREVRPGQFAACHFPLL